MITRSLNEEKLEDFQIGVAEVEKQYEGQE